MFFIFGGFVGMLVGALALLLSGGLLLFLRRLGLLRGDRRLWWSVAVAAALPLGFLATESFQAFDANQDSLEKGFAGFLKVGVCVGVLSLCGHGWLLLRRWGAGWPEPKAGASKVISLLCVVALVFVAVQASRAPDAIRAVESDRLARWVEAVQARDLDTLAAMQAAGEAEWGYLAELGGEPLAIAVAEGDEAFFAGLIRLRPYGDQTLISAAERAVQSDSIPLLQVALGEAGVNQNAVDAAMAAAVSTGNAEIYDWLFANHQPNPNAETSQAVLKTAVAHGREALVRDLVERGADIDRLDATTKYSPGESPLQAAVHRGHLNLVELLIELGADVDRCQSGSLTPLMRAVVEKNQELVETLLEAGADVRVATADGSTALHFACMGPRVNEPLARLLLEAGADPTLSTDKGFVPLGQLPEDLKAIWENR